MNVDVGTAASPGSELPARGPGRPALGRSTPLELDEILTTALRLVQEEGRDVLSMRKLAKEVGVTPMALYHHIPDKPSLMNALVERVWLEIYNGRPQIPDDSIETIIQTSVRIRKVWLEHFDLANLAVAVAEPDENFYFLTLALTAGMETAGVSRRPARVQRDPELHDGIDPDQRQSEGGQPLLRARSESGSPKGETVARQARRVREPPTVGRGALRRR